MISNPEGVILLIESWHPFGIDALDLRPFVPQNERERLGEFFGYLQTRVKQAFSKDVER